MSETSEEKSLPASEKKVRDAREKGQVAKSQDLVTGMILLTIISWLAFAVPAQITRVESLVNIVARRAWVENATDLWPELYGVLLQVFWGLSVPLLLIGLSVVVLTNVVLMKGVVFSTDPLIPKFEKIDPVKGAKKIFALRNAVEFLKSIIKLCALGTAFVMVFRDGVQGLMLSAHCGAPCIGQSFRDLLVPLLVTAIVTFLMVGAVDVLVQKWLFQRDLKMTKSEMKRERKDAEGDPAIMQQRRKQRREMQAYASKTGIRYASLLLTSVEGWAVGIRYVRGETSVPVVVCRAPPGSGEAMMQDAARMGIPVFNAPALAELIGRATRRGDPIPQAQFQRVADILVNAKLI